jgi:hypothetical protein
MTDMMEYRTSDQELNVFHDIIETCIDFDICQNSFVYSFDFLCCVAQSRYPLFGDLLLNRAHRLEVQLIHQPSITLAKWMHFLDVI